MSTRRTMQDAQDFIDSIKAFNKPEEKRDSSSEEAPETFKEISPSIPKLVFGNTFWPRKEIEIRKELITFIETFYFQYKSLPNKADFEQKFEKRDLPQSTADWEHLLLSLQEPLLSRGINPYETPLEYLEPNFVLAVNLICNAHDKRPIAAKLKEADLNSRQWKALLRKPLNQKYYNDRVNEIFNDDTANEAKIQLQKMVAAGDLQAIKHFHEVQNVYRPNQNQELVLILRSIMEILALHVAPDILSRVAQDFKTNVTLKELIA